MTPDCDTSSDRVFFSFDSSGWLYAYHFGVGLWLYDHLNLGSVRSLGSGVAEKVGFSGSSGGAMVAVVLATGVDPLDVLNYMIKEAAPKCYKNPLQMFRCAEFALRHFQFDGAHKLMHARLRVLLTRVKWRPPFFMGEVVNDFSDTEMAVQVLCASCHIPFLAGFWPRRINNKYYYDGLSWAGRLHVQWREPRGNPVVRVSAGGTPFSDITASKTIPFWWSVFPPPPDILRGIFWLGYKDAASWFSQNSNPLGSPSCPVRGNSGEDKNWVAARALLQDRNTELPARHPRSPDDICELIQLTEAYIDRKMRIPFLALSVVLLAFGLQLTLSKSAFF